MPSPILSRRTLLAGTTLLAAPAILSRRSPAAETMRRRHLGWRLCAVAA